MRLSVLPVVRVFAFPDSRRRLAIASAVCAALAYVAIGVLQWARLGTGNVTTGDWRFFFSGASALARGADPYRTIETCCRGRFDATQGYVYPPLFGELLRPLVPLGEVASGRAWLILSHLCFGLAVLVVWRTIGRWLTVTERCVLLVMACLFLPLLRSLEMVQAGALLLLLTALAAQSFIENPTSAAAGFWIAFATVLRVSPVFLSFALVRTWRFPRAPVLALVCSLGVLVGFMAITTPFATTFVTSVMPRLSQGSDYFQNVSLGAAVGRTALLATGSEPAPLRAAVLGVSAVLVAATWLMTRAADGPRGRAAVIAAWITLAAIVSPITWQHTLASELLAIALLLGLSRSTLDRTLLVCAYAMLWPTQVIQSVAYAVSGGRLDGWHLVPFTIVSNINLGGMLLLWSLNLVCLRREGRAPYALTGSLAGSPASTSGSGVTWAGAARDDRR